MLKPNVEEARNRIDICRRTDSAKINLSELALTELPQEIFQLTALTELDVRNNELTALPPEISQLTALTKLDVWNNQLTALPPEIDQLTALKNLSVRNNKLTALPPEIGQLTALTMLNVYNNKLTALPPEIGQLTALTHLNVDGNKLTALPPEIGQLTALTTLCVYEHELTALPPEIGQLTALTELNVHSNKLTALPSEIGQLTALTHLIVRNNKLTELPSSVLWRWSKMDSVDVLGNALNDPPLRIVEQGAAAVLRYVALKDRRRRQGWVAVASRLSRHFALRSVLAAAETGAMAVAIVAFAQATWPQPVWAAAAVAPVLLLKTPLSTRLGTRRFAWLMRKLGLKARTEPVYAPSLPIRLMGLGLGSVVIKLITTPYCVARRPTAALKAMPANLREQCFQIDLTCAPELIPGLERAYDRDPQSAFLFDDLVRPYDRKLEERDFDFGRWKRPTMRTLFAAPVLAVFFIVATVYRLYVKAAALLYLPLLLVDLPDRKRLLERTSASSKPGWNKLAIQGAVGGLALVGLLGLNGLPELQDAVGGWLNEKLLTVWKASSATDWLPKSVLSLLLLQATAHLAGIGAESMARSARADSGDSPLSAVARRWIKIAHSLYLIHVVLIIALLVGLFTALAPNAVLIVKGLWLFLT